MAQSTYSLDFDGTGYVGSGSTVDLVAGDFTVAMWVYPDSVSGYKSIFAGENNSIQTYFENATSLYWRLAGAEGSAASSATWTTGAWQHFAWKRSGTANTWYRNGSSCATLTRGTTASAELLWLARDRNGGGANFDGNIDHAAFWVGTALSDANIAALAAGTIAVGSLSPTLFWPLEEGSGTTTADDAGSNDGTFTGGVTWESSVPTELTSDPGGATTRGRPFGARGTAFNGGRCLQGVGPC